MIASELNQDPDHLLAKAGKVRSDLHKIILKHPRQFAAILRLLRGLEEPDFRVLVKGLAKHFKADFVLVDPLIPNGKHGKKTLIPRFPSIGNYPRRHSRNDE